MKNIFFLLIFLPIFVYSINEEQKTTIVVSSSGATIDEAKNNALRSALEQSFGAFISSKTEVLNDDIKDEIVSISNGSIHNYSIISQVEIPDGGYAITLEATISVTELKSLVVSKGIEVEFSGSLFGVKIKQQRLNETAEIVAINNLCEVASNLLKGSLDYNISVSEPKMEELILEKSISSDLDIFWSVNLDVILTPNLNYENFLKYFILNLQKISMSKLELDKYITSNQSTYSLKIIHGDRYLDQENNMTYNDRSDNLFFRTKESKELLRIFFNNSQVHLYSYYIFNDFDTIQPKENIGSLSNLTKDFYGFNIMSIDQNDRFPKFFKGWSNGQAFRNEIKGKSGSHLIGSLNATERYNIEYKHSYKAKYSERNFSSITGFKVTPIKILKKSNMKEYIVKDIVMWDGNYGLLAYPGNSTSGRSIMLYISTSLTPDYFSPITLNVDLDLKGKKILASYVLKNWLENYEEYEKPSEVKMLTKLEIF